MGKGFTKLYPAMPLWNKRSPLLCLWLAENGGEKGAQSAEESRLGAGICFRLHGGRRGWAALRRRVYDEIRPLRRRLQAQLCHHLLHGWLWVAGAKHKRSFNLHMHVLGGRQRPHAHERSRAVLKANQRGVPFAELLVELAVRVLKGERLENAPLPLDFPLAHTRADRDALIQRMRPAVEEMHDRWRGVPLGATLTVQWPERLRRSDPLSESVRLRAEHRRLAKRHRGGRRG